MITQYFGIEIKIMNKLYLWKYCIDGRRCGELVTGLFAATEEELNPILGKYIQLVDGDIEYKFTLLDFQKIEIPLEHLESILKAIGSKTLCGVNPIVQYYWGLEYECFNCEYRGYGTEFSIKESPLDSLVDVPKCTRCNSSNIQFIH